MALGRLVATIAVLALAANGAAAQVVAPLRVIRVSPGNAASPMAQISVTFDRPVAGSLDRTVDPATILRVDPAVAGKLEWRDPVTLRLIPAAPLNPGATYSVVVDNGFRAMDGSALAEPYRFTFRARGPTLLGGSPVDSTGPRSLHVRPDQPFSLVYSTAVDLAKISSAAYLEFSPACSTERIVRLRATDQRRLETDDLPRLREAGGWGRERSLDSLRRIVHLVPQSPLPHGCSGLLVAPKEADDQLSQGNTAWQFETYGDFHLAHLDCDGEKFCPAGPLRVVFTTPVRGAEVIRRVKVLPDTKFTVGDTSAEATVWVLEGSFKARTSTAVVVDTAIRDIFGQSLRGNPAAGYRTTGVAPSIIHPFGSVVVERAGFRTLSVQHVNIDTLVVVIAPVPDSLEAKALGRFAWGYDSLWAAVAHGTTEQRISVRGAADRAMVTAVRLPAPDARRRGSPTLFAVRVSGRANGRDAMIDDPVTLVQITDLGVHARIGVSDGAVWVTGVEDGKPRAGAKVVLRDSKGHDLASATTDAAGLARLGGTPDTNTVVDTEEGWGRGLEGYVTVTLGDDRAVTAVNQYDPDLSSWHFGVSDAWGDSRLPLAGALFTERGIYRPGERVYAKAIVRDGALGALHAPVAGDSIKWRFHDREAGMLRETTARLSAFGTSDQSFRLPAIAAVGYYYVDAQVKRLGTWRTVGQTSYRVAEYRPPEFLVDLSSSTAPHFPRDTFSVTLQARYLFGAPMGRAEFTWMAHQTPLSRWELAVPGFDDWYVGGGGAPWDDRGNEDRVFASGTDTLDAKGERTLRVTLPVPPSGQAARVTLETAVTDINRQVVGSSATTIVHPASFYVAVKPAGANYFWTAGTPQTVNVIAVRPDGEKVNGVAVQGTVARREWHSVRRERDGISELVGEWVIDTVATCAVTTAVTPLPCAFTPKAGGVYVATFRATDEKGRRATTTFTRWASGTDWVPWNDESQFKMDVIPDRTRYSVGDTATVLFASPFTDAEAWITVEREGLISERRLRLTSGSTTIKLPITEAYAPNAFVSILVARGRSAPPGPLDDPGRPTIRVGYASLRVTPEMKRLKLTLATTKTEYRPADTARVRIAVRDATGRGQKSEVTLWAVDEGVLALTGYKTPDPIDLIYRERGLGMRLRSNLTTVAPQVPEGEKGKREPGGGGGAGGADILRSRFQTTAFFLGSVVTDAAGQRGRFGEAARQPHDVPRDGRRGHRRRPLRKGRIEHAGDASAARAPGPSPFRSTGRRIHGRRRDQPARRCGRRGRCSRGGNRCDDDRQFAADSDPRRVKGRGGSLPLRRDAR